MIPNDEFPNLTEENHRITSPETRVYNCIAWAAADTAKWWQPGIFWPIPASLDDTGIVALEQMFAALGYMRCDSAEPETGMEKVVLYADDGLYTHAARQLSSGKWTSKLGKGEDIEHDAPTDVAGGIYGEVALFMRRAAS